MLLKAKADLVPKECGFNQSETAHRDGELIQMQHSCLHVDTIRHPNSSYVTTKL